MHVLNSSSQCLPLQVVLTFTTAANLYPLFEYEAFAFLIFFYSWGNGNSLV